jgi:uncharacterized membrane protein YjjB (DUF3815 family)
MKSTFAQRTRKAIAGGFSTGIGAVLSGFVFTGAPTKDQVGALIGAFIVGFVGGFYTVWKTKPNAPAL